MPLIGRCLGEGSLTLSTPMLDMSGTVAAMHANKVEMSLVDLELLPVVEPFLQ